MRTLARHRTTLLILLAALVAVFLTAWLGRGHATYDEALDPQNPGRTGAQALARVLDREGVSVDVVRSADAFDRTTTDAGTTIVVTASGRLGESTAQRLLAHQGDAHLVVVGAGPNLVQDLGVTSDAVTQTLPDAVPARCATYDGLSLDVPSAEAFPTPGCFAVTGGVVIADAYPGLTLMGAPDALSNDQVLDGDNAAIGLRLLGHRPHLVWYVPSLADLGGADAVSAAGLLPDWLVPALWMLLMAGVAVVVWRSRRLGPLAREPLPVSVKAVETTRNLGRLYRRAGDRGHAAEALRAAARARMAERLRLPRRTDHRALAAAVAAHTGRGLDEVTALLDPASPPPPHDRDLADLARRLDQIDREVSHV